MTGLRHPWPMPDFGFWCHGCVASGRRAFWTLHYPRSGQQAALGADVRDFMDALSIRSAILVGYDWGGRAACVVAALWPQRVSALIAITGYAIQDIAASSHPAPPEQEHRYWYQWYFHTERGRAGLAANRAELARLLWRLWSPNWMFGDAVLEATASSFDNPDFVDVTIQSYRHRYCNAPGDPAYADIERALADQPPIAVPTIVLHGEADGVGTPAGSMPREPAFHRRVGAPSDPECGPLPFAGKSRGRGGGGCATGRFGGVIASGSVASRRFGHAA